MNAQLGHAEKLSLQTLLPVCFRRLLAIAIFDVCAWSSGAYLVALQVVSVYMNHGKPCITTSQLLSAMLLYTISPQRCNVVTAGLRQNCYQL